MSDQEQSPLFVRHLAEVKREPMELSSDQKQKMEENKQKALARRATKKEEDVTKKEVKEEKMDVEPLVRRILPNCQWSV